MSSPTREPHPRGRRRSRRESASLRAGASRELRNRRSYLAGPAQPSRRSEDEPSLKIRNPNSEIRNNSQKTNPKLEIRNNSSQISRTPTNSKTRNPDQVVWNIAFVLITCICFGFRILCFEFDSPTFASLRPLNDKSENFLSSTFCRFPEAASPTSRFLFRTAPRSSRLRHRTV